MTKFADIMITVTDNARTAQIAAYEAAKVDRQFAPIKARAAANAAAMRAASQTRFAWA